MKYIINADITPTPEYRKKELKKLGVVELSKDYLKELKEILTIETLPTQEILENKAIKGRDLIDNYINELFKELGDVYDEDEDNFVVMLGEVHPALQSEWHNTMKEQFTICYDFSKREIKKETDGISNKLYHKGFIWF